MIGSYARRLVTSTPSYILRIAASFSRQNLGSLGGAASDLGGTLGGLGGSLGGGGLGADLGSAWVLLSWYLVVLRELYVLMVWLLVIEWIKVSLAHWPSQWEVVSKPDYSRVFIPTKNTPATSAHMFAQFCTFFDVKVVKPMRFLITLKA